MLWFMQLTEWILLNQLTAYKDVFWQREFNPYPANVENKVSTY